MHLSEPTVCKTISEKIRCSENKNKPKNPKINFKYILTVMFTISLKHKCTYLCIYNTNIYGVHCIYYYTFLHIYVAW